MPVPTPPTTAERDRRWSAIDELRAKHDLDVVIAHSDLGDHVGQQRYLSGYRSIFGDTASCLFSGGDSLMVVVNAGVVPFSKQLSWIDDVVIGAPVKPWLVGGDIDAPTVGGFSVGDELGDQLKRRGVHRIGLADAERFPSGWRDAIVRHVPEAVFVDLRGAIDGLRLVKSDEEQANIRTACRIADEVWADLDDLVSPGMTEYEVLANFEHRVRAAGAEDAFNMFFRLPMFSEPLTGSPNARRVQAGDHYTVEISPRFNGYYGQLTGLVSFGPADPEMRRAYEAINRGREAGVAIMRAGVDLTEVTAAVSRQLADDGFELASPLIGHFVGLELEEPRAGDTPLLLEAGMTFIFHPFIVGWPALMRADTYLVTDDGAERLTSLPLDLIELG